MAHSIHSLLFASALIALPSGVFAQTNPGPTAGQRYGQFIITQPAVYGFTAYWMGPFNDPSDPIRLKVHCEQQSGALTVMFQNQDKQRTATFNYVLGQGAGNRRNNNGLQNAFAADGGFTLAPGEVSDRIILGDAECGRGTFQALHFSNPYSQ